ncbi:MAG: ABC transporter substrate-binding protein, partial [Ferrovibrionaceae bacterium]
SAPLAIRSERPRLERRMVNAWSLRSGRTENRLAPMPSPATALGAQAVQVLAEAADKAGSSRDYDKIAQTLKSRKWDTLLGQISFTDKGQAMQNIYLVQVKNKQIVSVASGS